MSEEQDLSRHPVVSQEAWVKARQALLEKEKDFTKARDELARERRRLPWVKVEKPYVFEGAEGKRTLGELFGGRSQLVVYHFMFGPDAEQGCPHCSFWADQFDALGVHLHQRDTTFVAISRAPYPKLAAYEKRMGWRFQWLSSGGTDFNFDYHVSFRKEDREAGRAFYNFKLGDPGSSEREGVSAFYRDASGTIFHTYSTQARGIDLLNTTYNFLDLTAKGRDEGERSQYWVRRHDEYDSPG
jgi:predicted dithiol-disulfide oxidoreductase (DUF899 family)